MMKESFLRYLEHEKRCAKHTLLAYESDLDQFFDFLNQAFDLKEAAKATHQQVRSWTVELINEGRSASTINRKIATLKAFYRFLQKQNGLEYNPMVKVISPKMGKRLPTVIRADEMEYLFEHMWRQVVKKFYRIDLHGVDWNFYKKDER